MAVFFLVVAGLNLALGFALGAYVAQYLAAQSQDCVPQASAPITPPAPEKQPVVASHITAESAPTATPAIAAAAAEAPLPTEPAAAPPEPQPESVIASVAEFKAELSRYRDQLSTLDQRMRAGAETQDAAQIKECLTTLRSANDQYLEQQADVTGRFQSRCKTPDLEPVKEQLGAALDEQTAQVKRSNQSLADVDLENNLLISCQQLLDETSRLVDANHAMRDTLEDVELQLGRRGDVPVEADGPAADPQHNLISRAQLEATVAELWEQDPGRQSPLSIGLIDLDHFRELNEAHGLSVGDRVLDSVAQLVSGVTRDDQKAVRMSGKKFLLMFPGMPAREATNVLERVRQHVEATRFESSSGNMAVTVSCAVGQSNSTDTLPTLLERVEATLLEAKRYGRNRTFLHDGKFPAPVVPPVLPVESRILAV